MKDKKDACCVDISKEFLGRVQVMVTRMRGTIIINVVSKTSTKVYMTAKTAAIIIHFFLYNDDAGKFAFDSNITCTYMLQPTCISTSAASFDIHFELT